LSAEAYSKHGLKPSAVIFDELHAQPNRDLWDVMTFGAGDIREQPLWITITTAGDDPDMASIGWEIHEKARKIIAGEIIDKRWYCKIYGLDENKDIWDEKNWYDVNPSLGITIDIDKVRAAAESAKTNEAEEKLFRWLRLNQWVKVKETGWITHYLWDSVEKKIDVLKLNGKKCYAGLDLSSTVDLTAFSLVFPPQEGIDEWIILTEGWVPEKNIQKRIRVDKVPYDKWINKKFINATPGSAVDYDFIQATIEKYSKLFDIIYLGADQWNSRMLTQRLKKSVGMRVIEVPQTMTGMSQGMKYLERLIRDRKISHTGNPAERWCIGNVVVQVDGNENIKPMKNKSKERIDIAVAIINAMAIAVKYEKGSIYENRGVITL
jgi:phage terminase large subunit-like protein